MANLRERWLAHLMVDAETLTSAVERLRERGEVEIADAYDHASRVFLLDEPPQWSPLRLAVAVLLLAHPPTGFVTRPPADLVIAGCLGWSGPADALRGLWRTRGKMIVLDHSKPGPSHHLIVPGVRTLGDTPLLRPEVWVLLRQGIRDSAEAQAAAEELYEEEDLHGRSLLAFLCHRSDWAAEVADALVAAPPPVPGQEKRVWEACALNCVGSLTDPALAARLITRMITERLLPVRVGEGRPWADDLRHKAEMIPALLLAAEVDLRVLTSLLAAGGPAVERHVISRFPDPLRLYSGQMFDFLAVQGATPEVARGRLARLLAGDGENGWFSAPTFEVFAKRLGVTSAEVEGAATALVRANKGPKVLEKGLKGIPSALRQGLPELAVELFLRWRWTGADPGHAGVCRALVHVPSDAGADVLGGLLSSWSDRSRGNGAAHNEEARHREEYVTLLRDMDTDRAIGWLRKCATARGLSPELRRTCNVALKRVAKRRKVEVSALPRLDARSTALARQAESVQRALRLQLEEEVFILGRQLHETYESYEDDTYELRGAQIAAAWLGLSGTLAALLPPKTTKTDHKAILAELQRDFELACHEESPEWAP